MYFIFMAFILLLLAVPEGTQDAIYLEEIHLKSNLMHIPWKNIRTLAGESNFIYQQRLMDAQRHGDLLHTALSKWKDSERRDEFLAVKHHKCQTPNESLQDLLLILTLELQEGDGQGFKALLRTPNTLQDNDASEGLVPPGQKAAGKLPCPRGAAGHHVLVHPVLYPSVREWN